MHKQITTKESGLPARHVMLFLIIHMSLNAQPWPPKEHPKTPPPEHYTPPPEYRAKLLSEVLAAEVERNAKKQNANSVAIVRDAKPSATIVAGDDAQGAAKLLNQWIDLMSGTTLEVTTEQAIGRANIFLGEAAVKAGLDLTGIQSATNEGIRIKCDGKNVYIGWQNVDWPERAIGRFLEEQFGCRWLSTQPWGQVYDEQTSLIVHPCDISEKPGAQYRRIWGAEGAFRNRSWLGWSGNGGQGIAASHSWGFLTKEDFEKNPEWFRTDENGKRVYGHWPNMGNPELRKKFIEYALTMSENGTKSAISLSPPDNYRFDYSPEAKKYDNPDVIVPSTGWVSMTDRFMGIVNEAATEIYKRGKATTVGFYAYSDYTMPPTKPELQKLSPNIAVMIAPIRFSRHHPLGHSKSESRTRLREIIDGWSNCASMLGYRTYNYNLAEIMVPFSKITIWSHDMPYLHDRGCIGYNLESMDAWEIYAPHLYLSIRLAYDPTLDPWRIMADYWHTAYGPAAEAMEQYWMAIDQKWVNLDSEAGSIHSLPNVYSPEFLTELDGYLRRAEQVLQSSNLRTQSPKKNQRLAYRVQLARRGYRRAQYWRQWYDAVNAGEIDQVKSTYDEWFAFVTETKAARNGNKYELGYLRRFILKNIDRAYAALHPKDAPTNKFVMVFPDEWRYARQTTLDDKGVKDEPTSSGFDDLNWETVKTYSNTLNGQGHSEYFGTMWYRTTVNVPANVSDKLLVHFYKADRKVTLYINGKQVNQTENEAFSGTTIDASGHFKLGEKNQVTVKVRHIPLPELFLGGIVAPVYLIEQK